jgi:hypothetical protein
MILSPGMLPAASNCGTPGERVLWREGGDAMPLDGGHAARPWFDDWEHGDPVAGGPAGDAGTQGGDDTGEFMSEHVPGE